MGGFSVQARVLDLLGREQIANCPTAISELFKNAWDAYAQRAAIDVYANEGRALVWDDGQGMSLKDVEERWLVVGASGKREAPASIKPPEGYSPRPVQGEKGIGRLAISTLGDSLLLISRSATPARDGDPYVALFVNWNVVRNDKLMLGDIFVPLLPFTSLEDLESGIVEIMIADFRRPIEAPTHPEAWSGRGNEELRQRILLQLEQFRLDMASIRRTPFAAAASGTLFYIQDLTDEIPRYLRPPRRYEEDEEEPNEELVQLLCNFRNPFQAREETADPAAREELPFSVDVRRWDKDLGELRSAFADWETIGPDDLRDHDHFVDVHFDEWGRFDGLLEVYGESVELPPIESQQKRKMGCGPFELRFWYVQGRDEETTLPTEQWARMASMGGKLDHFGGLMIYRDGLRVLPYGRPEFDWLRIEERRSRHAGRYHFSYRRMFGYVAITSAANGRLKDKAGREGLIADVVYGRFRQRLIDFLSEIALRHFYKSEAFAEAQEEARRHKGLVDEEAKRADERRKGLLEAAYKKLESCQQGLVALKDLLQGSIDELTEIDGPNSVDIAGALLRFQDRVATLEGKARLTVPRRLAIGRSRELKRTIHDYRVAHEQLRRACDEARSAFSNAVRERYAEADQEAARRKALRDARRKILAKVGTSFADLCHHVNAEYGRLIASLGEFRQVQERRVDGALLEAAGATSVDEALATGCGDVGHIIAEMDRAAVTAVESIESMRESLTEYIGQFFEEARDALLVAQADEIEELREVVDRNLQLVQLGLAVEIIDHELNRLYDGIKQALGTLRVLLRNAPRSSQLIEEVRASFQTLEQRYKLMSPLYRASNRKPAEIGGQWIFDYVAGFLARPLHAYGIELAPSAAFLSFRLNEVPAVVLPVFVNLVDNAVYWVRDAEEKRIELDVVDGVVTVCDSGPGIHDTLLEDIFEPFFSTKPRGRGLGLYVARANLERFGHRIWATNEEPYRAMTGACFCIRFHEDVVKGPDEEPAA